MSKTNLGGMYMKKLLAGFLTLSLVLAACSNGSNDDDGNKDDNSKDNQSSDDQSKDNEKDSKNDDEKNNDSANDNSDSNSSMNGTDSNANDDNNSENDENANHNSDNNANNSSESNSDSNAQNNASPNDNTSSNANSNQEPNRNSNSNADNSSNATKNQYVAPYQGQNAVPVAQNITSGNTDAQVALQSLPHFQNALDNATAEVNALNGQSNPYNDYAIEGSDGNYSYIFSFQNQAQPGTYSIVTVDQQGTVRVVDPAYQQ